MRVEFHQKTWPIHKQTTKCSSALKCIQLQARKVIASDLSEQNHGDAWIDVERDDNIHTVGNFSPEVSLHLLNWDVRIIQGTLRKFSCTESYRQGHASVLSISLLLFLASQPTRKPFVTAFICSSVTDVHVWWQPEKVRPSKAVRHSFALSLVDGLLAQAASLCLACHWVASMPWWLCKSHFCMQGHRSSLNLPCCMTSLLFSSLLFSSLLFSSLLFSSLLFSSLLFSSLLFSSLLCTIIQYL